MFYGRAQFEYDMEVLDELDSEISRAIADGLITGIQSLTLTRDLEQKRRECKGKLFGTSQMMRDVVRNKKGKCMMPHAHKQTCYCRTLTGIKLAEASAELAERVA